MKKIMGVMLAVCVASGALLFGGCAKKAAENAAVDPQARRLLVEGTAYLKQGEVVKAVQDFATAIKTSPDYFEAYYMLGETFIHLKQFPQAQAVLTGAVNRFPDNPLAYYLLSAAYEGSGNLMPAIIAARKSVDLFQARQDEDGTKRATVLLGALVQAAKQQAETDMVNNAAQDAAKAAKATTPAVAQ
jgi:tetratricopeptide (TPR) repeat protein